MFHLVGLVGNNASHSHNRQLLQVIANHQFPEIDLELLEISNLPMYNQDIETHPVAAVTQLRAKVAEADGVIIATPEHNHSIPAVLKNALDWASRIEHPFEGKPVLLVGAALGPMGTLRAQQVAREILRSPGLGAHVYGDSEFLLADAAHKFNEDGKLTDPATDAYLAQVMADFTTFLHHELQR